MQNSKSAYLSPNYIQKLISDSELLLGNGKILIPGNNEVIIRETKERSQYDQYPNQRLPDPFIQGGDPRLQNKIKTVEFDNPYFGEGKEQRLDLNSGGLTETVKRSGYNVNEGGYSSKKPNNFMGEQKIEQQNRGYYEQNNNNKTYGEQNNKGYSQQNNKAYGEQNNNGYYEKTNKVYEAQNNKGFSDNKGYSEQKNRGNQLYSDEAFNNERNRGPNINPNRQINSPQFVESRVNPFDKLLSPPQIIDKPSSNRNSPLTVPVEIKQRRLSATSEEEPFKPLISEGQAIESGHHEKLKQSKAPVEMKIIATPPRNDEELRELERKLMDLNENVNLLKQELKRNTGHHQMCELKPDVQNLDLEVKTMKEKIKHHVEVDHRVVKPTSWCC